MSMQTVFVHRTSVFLLLMVLFISCEAFGGRFGEHKIIGDEALKKAREALRVSEAGSNDRYILLCRLLKCSAADTSKEDYVFKSNDEQQEHFKATYGDLTALSGDHTESPLQLSEELNTKFSRILRVLLLQHEYMKKYAFEAPDLDAASVDPEYIRMAIDDKSHFYDYTKDLIGNIAEFDSAVCRKLYRFENPKMWRKTLYNTNSINKYITLHTLAMAFAQDAAKCAETDQKECHDRLIFAFYVSAYADHFLQDAFSAGHRVVKRTYLGSFRTNKFIHDFFGQRGLPAQNLRRESWISYGDGQMDKKVWERNPAFTQQHSKNMEKAISSDSTSIMDVFAAFLGTNTIDLDSLPDGTNDDSTFCYFSGRFKSLSYLPIPYDGIETTLESISGVSAPSDASVTPDTVKKQPATPEELIEQSSLRTNRLVQTVTNHTGIGLSLIYGRYSDATPHFKNEVYNPGSVLGYSLALRGIVNTFGYDNMTLERSASLTLWVDLAFTNLFVWESKLNGTQYKLGVNTVAEFYLGENWPIEIGIISDFGYSRFGKTRFRYEPSFEFGIAPHSWWTGFKLRFSWLKLRDYAQEAIGIRMEVGWAIDRWIVDGIDRFLVRHSE